MLTSETTLKSKERQNEATQAILEIGKNIQEEIIAQLEEDPNDCWKRFSEEVAPGKPYETRSLRIDSDDGNSQKIIVMGRYPGEKENYLSCLWRNNGSYPQSFTVSGDRISITPAPTGQPQPELIQALGALPEICPEILHHLTPRLTLPPQEQEIFQAQTVGEFIVKIMEREFGLQNLPENIDNVKISK